MGKIGFIGLGIMGKPMAVNLLKAGYELIVSDIDKERVKEVVEAGAKSGTYSEIGTKCDIVITILPNGAIVNEVLFGQNGVTATLPEGKLICDMSSVTIQESQSCYDRLKNMNISFIDAPVSGGELGAIEGTLAIMCGGDEKAFHTMLPYFNVLGKKAVLIGPSGSGSMAKMANQVIVNLTIAAISEALVLAVKAGADPMKVYQAIRGGLAGSAVLDAKVPMMCRRNFKPGGKISINYKDIKNVLDTAYIFDVPMPLTTQLLEIQKVLKIKGHINDDHGGYIQYFEHLANVVVKSDE